LLPIVQAMTTFQAASPGGWLAKIDEVLMKILPIEKGSTSIASQDKGQLTSPGLRIKWSNPDFGAPLVLCGGIKVGVDGQGVNLDSPKSEKEIPHAVVFWKSKI
jgi:hypothetical protein